MPEKINGSIKIEELIPILDGISDAVFIDDSSGYCIWCNKACEELYKVSSYDVQGRHIEELEEMGIFTPSVAKRVFREQREITIIHENKNGKKLLTTGTPIFNGSDEISNIITTSRDITRLTDKGQLPPASKPVIDVNSMEQSVVPKSGMIAASVAMQNVMTLTNRLATVNSTVLITGESGVGKELIAKLLHKKGNRSSGPFITVNCGAIPENLIESELFGYVPGAFTGSRSDGKSGLFEAAQNGTIFLDEISELPLNLQVKLLRVIQEREITPVGGIKTIPIDVRIVSATNKSLMELVKKGLFREDLYYRLNVVPINVPPLRERPEDVLPLIKSNLMKYNSTLHENKEISQEALTVLLRYPWPGNTRELQNIIERLIITTSGNTITEDNIPIFIKEEAAANTNISTDTSLAAAMDKAEKAILTQALSDYRSTRAMAKVLKVSQPTIVRKLHKYGLSGSDS